MSGSKALGPDRPGGAGRPSSAVSVDRNVCVGSGYCQRIAPEVFDLDESGLAVVLLAHPAGPQLDAAREAEGSCPSLAITLPAG
jgi:ferredoxin